jgi:excisionase family DNA binding protein
MDERLRAIGEVSKVLGVSTFTIRRLISSGLLRCVRVSRRVLIPQSEVDRVCATGCAQPNAGKQE